MRVSILILNISPSPNVQPGTTMYSHCDICGATCISDAALSPVCAEEECMFELGNVRPQGYVAASCFAEYAIAMHSKHEESPNNPFNSCLYNAVHPIVQTFLIQK